MPELPQVEALKDFLNDRLVGRAISRIELVSFAVLKTYDPPLTALLGLDIDRVTRVGKFVDISAQGLHLIFHLARAGWLMWREHLPDKPIHPGKGPICLRVGLSENPCDAAWPPTPGPAAGFDLTEAGTQRKLAVYLTTDPTLVPGIASLGPDPMAPDFTPAVLDAILATAGRTQLKSVLRDQHVIAGIGNAYSDDILCAAKMSPFKPACNLDAAGRVRLYTAIREELRHATDAARGLTASELKKDKCAHLRVHGRTGEPCDICGTPIAEVSFADSSLQYCPSCQTGGKPLADRRMSRLLK